MLTMNRRRACGVSRTRGLRSIAFLCVWKFIRSRKMTVCQERNFQTATTLRVFFAFGQRNLLPSGRRSSYQTEGTSVVVVWKLQLPLFQFNLVHGIQCTYHELQVAVALHLSVAFNFTHELILLSVTFSQVIVGAYVIQFVVWDTFTCSARCSF